jgi:hypothetical protein
MFVSVRLATRTSPSGPCWSIINGIAAAAAIVTNANMSQPTVSWARYCTLFHVEQLTSRRAAVLAWRPNHAGCEG